MQFLLLEVVALGLGLLVHAPKAKRAVPMVRNDNPRNGSHRVRHLDIVFRQPDIVTDYITQWLDHFDKNVNATFQQRYMMNDKHYNDEGTAFLKVGGETAITEESVMDGYGGDWMVNAYHFHAICFVLEHRYYGESNPVSNFTTHNLQWLSVEQALEDIATFIEEMNEEYEINEPKWILFGCSYAGNLAAWARLQMPELVHGAVISSPPLEPKTNFWEFLETTGDVIRSYDSACLQNIATATQAMERWIDSQKDLYQLMDMFGAGPDCDLTDNLNITVFFVQLFYSIAEVVELGGNNKGVYAKDLTIQKICKIINNRSMSPCAIERYANAIRYITATTEVDSIACNYNEFVQDMRWNPEYEYEDESLWLYQTCKEIGLFPSTDMPGCTPFGKRFSIQYYYRLCRDVFGEEFTPEQLEKNVEFLNRNFLGKHLNVSNVIVINGSNDPYQRVSIVQDTGLGPKVVYMYGTAHCADIYPSKEHEMIELILGRAKITAAIRQWLDQ